MSKPYREFVESARCDCVCGFIEVYGDKWYESHLAECEKCNGGENSDKEFSKIHNLVG
jgi:hypothetical protein